LIEIDDEHLAPTKTHLFHTRGILHKTSHVRLGTGNSIVRGSPHKKVNFNLNCYPNNLHGFGFQMSTNYFIFKILTLFFKNVNLLNLGPDNIIIYKNIQQ